jgi:hypothetical protein
MEDLPRWVRIEDPYILMHPGGYLVMKFTDLEGEEQGHGVPVFSSRREAESFVAAAEEIQDVDMEISGPLSWADWKVMLYMIEIASPVEVEFICLDPSPYPDDPVSWHHIDGFTYEKPDELG